MTATLTVAGANVSGVSFDATVTVGRDDYTSQPDASVLGVTIVGWEPAGQLGDPVTLADSHGRMFGGTVTDFDCTLDMGSGDWMTRLSAVGPLADLGRTYVGDEPWPQETDSQRVKRVLDLAAAPASVNPNIGGPQILPRDVDHQTALDVLDSVATSALGVLWEQPADTVTPIRYQPQRVRTWGSVAGLWSEVSPNMTWSAVPASIAWEDWYSDVVALPGEPGSLTLNARDVLAEVTFAQRISTLARSVRVTYGPAPVEGERPVVVMGAGTPEVKWDTELADSTGATSVADSILRARREPAWLLNEIRMPLELLPPATVAAIRGALSVGLRLTIENINFHSPIGTTWQGYVEGWGHEVGGDYHTLTLHTSERRLTEPADRWQDVTPALNWSAVTPIETWATAVEVS